MGLITDAINKMSQPKAPTSLTKTSDGHIVDSANYTPAQPAEQPVNNNVYQQAPAQAQGNVWDGAKNTMEVAKQPLPAISQEQNAKDAQNNMQANQEQKQIVANEQKGITHGVKVQDNPPSVAPTGAEAQNKVGAFNDKQNEQSEVKTKQEDTTPAIDRAWRNIVTDDEREQKRKKTILAINAIGDTLRNLGNLYYTTKGAAPQAIANNTQQLWEQYENERKEKEAKEAAAAQTAYKHAQDKANLEEKKRLNDSTIERNNAATKATMQKMGIDATKAPYEIGEMVAKYNNLVSENKIKEADAMRKQIEATYAKAKEEAEIRAKNASTASSYASAANSYASADEHKANTAKAWQEVGQNKGGVKVTGFYGSMSRNRKNNITSDQIANMYNSLVKQGLLSKENFGESQDTSAKQMNAIMDAMQNGNQKQRQAVTHELVNSGWYTIDGADRKKQFDRANVVIKNKKVKTSRVQSFNKNKYARHNK